MTDTTHADKPQEGDYTISGPGVLGHSSCIFQSGISVADFDNEDRALRFIKKRCDAKKFWPNVWRVDNGKATLLNSKIYAVAS